MPASSYAPEAVAVINAGSLRNMLHVIVNPTAGNGRAGKTWPEINNALAAHGFETLAHFTTRPGEATEIARRLANNGAGTIVAVGGDGTLNEVVNGLMEHGLPVNPEIRLALMPAGTGKDFCRTLGVQTIEKALHAIDSDVTARIDVGRIRFVEQRSGDTIERYFVNCADAGLGAEAAAKINASTKRFGAITTYLTGAVRAIAAFSFRDATFTVDGQEIFSGSSGMAVFANGSTFGGGMRVAPDASLCDGLLEIFVLQDVGKRALLTSLLPRVYGGKHVGRPGVLYMQGKTASVSSSVEMLLEVDGEQIGRAPLEVDLIPGALRVIGNEQALAKVGGCTNGAT